MTLPTFDPCKQWLGIDAVELGDPRRVLGLPAGPLDAQAIVRAATNRLSLLQSVAPGAFAMAHAALVRRVTEARDTLLAESVTMAAPGFSMPPPPDGGAAAMPSTQPPPAFATVPAFPPLPAVPRVPAPPPLTSVPTMADAPPPIVLPSRRVPRYRPQSSVGPIVLLVVAGLGMAAGAIAYRAHQQSKAREVAALARRQVAIDAARKREKEPAAPPVPAIDEPQEIEEQIVDDVSTSPPPAEQEKLNEERRSRLKPRPDPQASGGTPAPPTAEPAEAGDAPERAAPPQPPAEPEPSADTDKPPAPDAEGLLKQAFGTLQQQKFAAANDALEAARKAATDRGLKDRIASFVELAHYAEKFSGYRDQAMADLRAGLEYDIPTATTPRKIAIVEINDKEIVYREAGHNDRWPRDKIPAGVVTHIVREWFDKRPENHVFMGAYFATKPEPDLAKARAEWMKAQAGGVDVSGLLPLLNDPLLQAE